MRKTNLVEFSELLEHAETLGYKWNEAHEILDNDNIRPTHEIHENTIHFGDDEEFEWSEDTKKIVYSFMKKQNVNVITVIDE